MVSISVSHLSVDFAIFGANSRSLKKRLVAQATGGRLMSGVNDAVVVRALDDISLEIGDGERIGLVGHNGSGKSTLLRVLAGIYHPTAGSVRVRGKVGALIDPRAGMEEEATGMQNIFLRGRLLGLSNIEIARNAEEIVEFSGLESFINLPLRTYSTGMTARLAFAISTAIAPDILLIDEGMGAGDAGFMEKVRVRIAGLVARSPILVFASHDQTLIQQLCNRTITLGHGRVITESRIDCGAIIAPTATAPT